MPVLHPSPPLGVIAFDASSGAFLSGWRPRSLYGSGDEIAWQSRGVMAFSDDPGVATGRWSSLLVVAPPRTWPSDPGPPLGRHVCLVSGLWAGWRRLAAKSDWHHGGAEIAGLGRCGILGGGPSGSSRRRSAWL
jgi:hypothetical protein